MVKSYSCKEQLILLIFPLHRTSFLSSQASDPNPLSPPVLFYHIFYTVERTYLNRPSQVSALTTFFETDCVTTRLNYSIEVVALNEVGYSQYIPLIGMQLLFIFLFALSDAHSWKVIKLMDLGWYEHTLLYTPSLTTNDFPHLLYLSLLRLLY